MTPLRAKYIRDLTIRGRAQRTQRAYTRYVSELALSTRFSLSLGEHYFYLYPPWAIATWWSKRHTNAPALFTQPLQLGVALARLSQLEGLATREAAPEAHRGQKACTTRAML